uniref:Uncharacterized protein n=1 Tax=Arundo donax TaxID=35708 RepID=A0A0A8XWK7_ARUDO
MLYFGNKLRFTGLIKIATVSSAKSIYSHLLK